MFYYSYNFVKVLTSRQDTPFCLILKINPSCHTLRKALEISRNIARTSVILVITRSKSRSMCNKMIIKIVKRRDIGLEFLIYCLSPFFECWSYISKFPPIGVNRIKEAFIQICHQNHWPYWDLTCELRN